jgi:hypothetical protein
MVGPQVISRLMQSPDFEAFGSSRPRGQDSAASQWQRRAGSKTELEFNPHDGVHQSIGGNMASVDLSSRDPIFFLHHANVDRLWSSWNARGNANSSEAMWRNFAFNRNFLTGGGAAWDVSVGDLNSTPALGYRYDGDDSPFAANVAMPVGDPVIEKAPTAAPWRAGFSARLPACGGSISPRSAASMSPAPTTVWSARVTSRLR